MKISNRVRIKAALMPKLHFIIVLCIMFFKQRWKYLLLGLVGLSLSADRYEIYPVRSVYDVGNASSGFISPPRLPHFRVLRGMDGSVRLEGELPTGQAANQLTGLVVDRINHQKLINSILVDPEVTAPPWTGLIAGILAQANHLEIMEVELGAGRLVLGGLIDNQSDYNDIIQRVQQSISGQNLEFVNRIGVHPLAREMGK